MRKIASKTTIVGFAGVIGLLLTASSVQAQAPVPTTITNTYAAKFICGVQPDASLKAVPDAQAGHYSTKINVHNNTGIDITYRKKVIQLKGGQVPTPPAWFRFETLKPDYAMEVVCRDIYGHLGIPIPPAVDVPPPYIEGFVIFEVAFTPVPSNPPDDPLDVEGIYTYRAEPVGTDAVSIHVQVFPAKRNRYDLPTAQPAGAAVQSSPSSPRGRMKQ